MKLLCKLSMYMGMVWGTIASGLSYNPHQLISRPQDVLKDIECSKRAFDEKYNKQLEDFTKSQKSFQFEALSKHNRELMKAHEQRSPIFLLGECTGNCCLDRLERPQLRQELEAYVLRMVDDRVSHIKKRAWQYVSFGSGGMFQDLVVLTKILQKYPQAHLDIHLIDHQYAICADSGELMEEPVYQVDHLSKSFQSILDKLVVRARSMAGYQEGYSHEKLCCTLTTLYMQLERMGQQFLMYLKDKFPQANLSLFLHKDGANYLTYVKLHNKQYPDVIACADLLDEISLFRESYKEYTQFMLESLQHNPQVVNVALSSFIFERGEAGGTLVVYSKADRTNLQGAYRLDDPIKNVTTSNQPRWLLENRELLKHIWGLPPEVHIYCFMTPLLT